MTIGTSDGTNKIGFLVKESTPFDKASMDLEGRAITIIPT
jgi:hypothetical protein